MGLQQSFIGALRLSASGPAKDCSRPTTAVRASWVYVCDAAIAAAHGLIVSFRSQPHSGHSGIKPRADPDTGFR